MQDNNSEIRKKRMKGFDIEYPIVEEMRKSFFDKSISSKFEELDKNIGRSIIPITLNLKEDNLKLINDTLLMNEKKIIFDYLKSKNLLVKENNGKSGFSGYLEKDLMYLPYLDIDEKYYLDEDIKFFSEIKSIGSGMFYEDKGEYKSQLCLVLDIYEEITKKRMKGLDPEFPIVEEIKKNFFDKSISSDVKNLDKHIKRSIIPVTLNLKEDNLKLINDTLLMNEKKIIFDYLKSKDLLVKENNGKTGFSGNDSDKDLMYLPYLALNEKYYLKDDIQFFSKITSIESGTIDIDNGDNTSQLNLILDIYAW